MPSKRERTERPPEGGVDTKRALVSEFKKIDKRELKKLMDISSIDPVASANDCSLVLDTSINGKHKKNTSVFIVSSNDEAVQEEVAGLKKELHKERQKNAELWCVYRKAGEQLKEVRREYEGYKGKNKKDDASKASAKSYIEKQVEEFKEQEKISQSLKDEQARLAENCKRLDDQLKSTTKCNDVYQKILKKMMKNSITKEVTIECMKMLHLIPVTNTKKQIAK